MTTFLGGLFIIIGITSVLFGTRLLTGTPLFCTPPPVGSIWEMEQGPDPFIKPLRVRVEEVKEGYVRYVFWSEKDAEWLDKHAGSGASDDCGSFLRKYQKVD